MTDNANGYAMTRTPTLYERFIRWAGFRSTHNDMPQTAELMPGWMMTHLHIDFCLSDRLRLLLTGRLRIRLEQRTSAVVDEAVSVASPRILAPFEKD